MKCFYHVDADGKCAAFWVKWFVGSSFENDKDEYIKINYGIDFPFDKIRKVLNIEDCKTKPYYGNYNDFTKLKNN